MWCRSRVRVGDNSAHWDGAGVAGRLGSALRLQGGQQRGAVGFGDDSHGDGGGGAGWLGGAVGGGCGHQGSQIYKQLKGHLKLRQSGRSEILSHGAADMVMVVADT